MIVINKEEAAAVREKFPEAHIVRTMKHKTKRHRYYCEETSRVLKFIDSMRHPENNT